MSTAPGRNAPPTSEEDLRHNRRGQLSPAQAEVRIHEIRRWRRAMLLWFTGTLAAILALGCGLHVSTWGVARTVGVAAGSIAVLVIPLAWAIVHAFRRQFEEVHAGEVRVVNGPIDEIHRSATGSPIVYLTVGGMKLGTSHEVLGPKATELAGQHATVYYLPRTHVVVAVEPIG